MTNSQLENFFLNKTYDYSKWEKQVTDYGVDDIDEDLLIKYVNKGLESGRINFLYRDAKTTLKKLELLSGNKLNNAGFYLFSNKKPLLLKLATYPTDERIRFTDLKQFHGNIFECINEAVKYVANNIHWSANIIGMERKETPEIPFEAFREIIINSFVHMRVNPTSSNEIYITPTKIHIYNPGSLVPGTDPIMFASGEQGSMIRNPLIATVLYYNKTIDAFGTGFERVFKLCKNIKYEYNNNQFGFTFEFSRQNNNFSNNDLKEVESLNNSLTKDELKIIELIKSKKCNKDEMAVYINKSKATVNRIIKSLTEKGLIQRIGSNKTGYWKNI
jgi:ATP-dependent DNA helicase RecG